MKKIGPKDGLLIADENNYNKIFYRDFMMEYFDIKTFDLLNILNNSKKYIEDIKSKELEIGKIKIGFGEINEEKITAYAKSEIMSTYYHCLETFIRLFIAHSLLEPYPIIEIANLSIEKYKKYLNDFSNGIFDNLNDKLSGDETILFVIFGFSDFKKSKIPKENFDKVKNWIKIISGELLSISEYNSFKHGLNMFQGFGSFSIKPDGSDKVIKKEGDSIYLMERYEDEKRYKFKFTCRFIDCDFKITVIRFVNEMIKNIMELGKIRYISKEEFTLNGLHAASLDYFELRKKFYNDGDIGYLMNQYSQNLFYYDDLTEEGKVEFDKLINK